MTTWEYDTANHGVGKASSVDNSNGYHEEFFYDAYGRANGNAVTIDQEQYFTVSDFDDYGRVTKVSYPNGFAVRNAYDAKGFFVRVSDASTGKAYWSANAIDVLGRLTDETYGNGVSTIKHYDPTDERIRSISAKGDGGAQILDLAVDYDLLGNLKSRNEAVERKKESFGYDALNRLVTLISVDTGRSDYRYDAAGRFTYKAGIGDYHYADHPGQIDGGEFKPFHGVLGTNYGKWAGKYRYDLNGNMISAPQGHLDYTADDKLKLIYLDQAHWARFDYGPGGDRFRQFSRLNDASEETLYLGLSEKVIDYALSTNSDFAHPAKFGGFDRLTRSRNYIANGSGVFAVVETDDSYANNFLVNPVGVAAHPWYGKFSTNELCYIHVDQLGSILRVTDQDGQIRERFWYDPWGARTTKESNQLGPGEAQQIAGSWKRGFTGHEHLDAFSLIHMNGRVYHAALAMFTSVDAINQMATDTQGGNGYAYARGNPLRYTDPSGFGWFSDFIHNPGKAIGNLVHNAGREIGHAASETGKWFAENWKTVVVVVVVIVVIVATDGAASGLAGAILQGAAAGAAAGATGAALYGGSPEDILQAAVKGAVIGGISGAAFYGVGSYFQPTEAASTTSQIELMAAHGVVGGAKSAAEGGDFWKGFIATAATKASSLYGPDFQDFTANATKAAVVGGTISIMTGDKFANGAILGAFSYSFNDALHPPPPSVQDDAIYPTWSPLDFVGGEVVDVAVAGYEAIAGLFAEEALIGESAEGAASFFEDTQYSSKVLQQMEGGVGEFHSFPESVTAFEEFGSVSTITGGDQAQYQMLRIPGSYQSSAGTWYEGEFQFMKDSNGLINHRFFKPTIPVGP